MLSSYCMLLVTFFGQAYITIVGSLLFLLSNKHCVLKFKLKYKRSVNCRYIRKAGLTSLVRFARNIRPCILFIGTFRANCVRHFVQSEYSTLKFLH